MRGQFERIEPTFTRGVKGALAQCGVAIAVERRALAWRATGGTDDTLHFLRRHLLAARGPGGALPFPRDR